MLKDYHPTPFAAADIEIKRQLLLSLANTRLNQVNQSNHELQTAQQLSIEDDSALQGEVLQTEGLIEFHRDQLASASDSFQRSLEFARQHGDKFLETSDLLNLGTVVLHYEEYDEALARFEDASQIARSTGARLALELALGNAGWAYYKLGDFEKSLFDFQQAELQARELGSINDQIVWSTYTGLSYYRLGDLKSAEANYRRALRRRSAANDKELIAATHTELGFLFFQRRNSIWRSSRAGKRSSGACLGKSIRNGRRVVSAGFAGSSQQVGSMMQPPADAGVSRSGDDAVAS